MKDERIRSVAQSCLSRRTRATAAVLSRHYGAQLRSTGLSGVEFSLLVAIAGEDGPNVSAVAEALGFDSTTVVRNLKHLERRGFVESEGGRGRTGKRLRLTDEGEAAISAALDSWDAVNRTLVEKLGAERVKEGLRFLEALEEAALASAAPRAPKV
ncbi:MarR family winged helix-turn-helix transcriptional regulator [Microvirga terrestris]|uniref:Winged helix-turn-helix transcriptional regulator n=1 Tax=Microvirga terrestris TaxID=2791024 RepID=A0ABS0HV58_9HYPH|nr:MarR family winged helix-turn-helix transcriptional regulator [Microvirga terrestris]MBF9197397.1 winged helix-turn-helix transcriptional regulator [Microvirga terrestris]